MYGPDKRRPPFLILIYPLFLSFFFTPFKIQPKDSNPSCFSANNYSRSFAKVLSLLPSSADVYIAVRLSRMCNNSRSTYGIVRAV